MRMRIAILSMIALACATEIAVAGPLPSDFTQKLIFAAIGYAAIYLLYPIIAVVSFVFWRRGRRALSVGLAALLLLVGFVFPAVHQRAYAAEHALIQEATVIPEKLDLSGKTVLLVASHCHDLCDVLLTYSDLKALYRKDIHGDTDKTFLSRGLLAPEDERLLELTLNAEGRQQRNSAPDSALADVDFIIYRNLYNVVVAPSLSERVGANVAHLGVRYLMAPVQDIKSMSIDDVEPVLLVFYSNSKSYQLPFHPWRTVRLPVLEYGEIDRLLADLFCPESNMRLRFGCSQSKNT